MAVPSTKATFKEYCLRALGKPVIDINVDDLELLNNLVESLEAKICDYKNKLCYVWKYGTPYEKGQVLGTLGNHIGYAITPKDLTDEQKLKIGLEDE